MMAPSCMTTSNMLAKGSLNSMKWLTIMRCPVLLIGRNSVMPSTMPIIPALTRKSIKILTYYV